MHADIAESTALIYRASKPNVALAGDSMGLNAKTISNYLKQGAYSTGLFEDMQNQLRVSTPTLKADR